MTNNHEPTPTPELAFCSGKEPHPTRKAAMATLKRFDNQRSPAANRRALKPYRCPHCGQWHLGHSSKAKFNGR